jgi:ketosteroid isomerase-like protein
MVWQVTWEGIRMSEHDYAALLRKGYQAMADGDAATVVGLFAADGTMHNAEVGPPLGGDHHGREAIAANLGALFQWTGGTLRFGLQEIFFGEEHAVALVRETARRARDGATLDLLETHLFRFRDGEVAEFWDLPSAQQRSEHDEFFSAAH